MNKSDTFTLTPLGVWQMALRHKKKILLFPILILFIGGAVILYFPRTYRSQSQLFLRLGRESVGLDPTATTGQTISLQQGDRKDEVKSAMEVIKSRGVIAQVVDKLGSELVLGKIPQHKDEPNKLSQAVARPLSKFIDWYRSIDPIGDRERAIVQVERHLYVGAERGATLIEISYEAESPQLAQAVCNAFVDVYQKEHMRIQRSDESRPFFEEQQGRLRQQLDGALEAVRQAKNEMGLADIEQRRATLEAQFAAVELDRLVTQQQSATSQARADELQQQLMLLPERLVASKKSVPNVGADLLRDQLYTLEVKSMDLQSRYTANHPKVRAVNEQLQDAKQIVTQQTNDRSETTDEINPVYRQLLLDLKQERGVLAGQKARLTALSEQNRTILAGLQSLNANELKIDQLSRDADLAREKYMQYAKNLEEARIDKELERGLISNLSVVQEASLNERPVSPSKPLVAIATLLLATAGTLALVVGSEWLHMESPSSNGVAIQFGMERSAAPRNRVRRRKLPIKTNGRHSGNGHN